MKGTASRGFFIVFLPILTVRWYFLVRYIFVKSIKIGPLISHIFRITNHRSLFFLKTSIYIQIVIRWASIHRLSICIIDLPTTGKTTCTWVQLVTRTCLPLPLSLPPPKCDKEGSWPACATSSPPHTPLPPIWFGTVFSNLARNRGWPLIWRS